MLRLLLVLLLQMSVLTLSAQRADIKKMSPMVRHIAYSLRPPSITAFVQTTSDEEFFARNGCRSLYSWGDIHAVSIPLSKLGDLSLRPEVLRIEAGKSCTAQVDTTMSLIGVSRVHEGESLPQAFTGRGVVVGIQDVGFDLTHPTFYDSSTSTYRVKRFWDQLSVDTIGSAMPVGRDYTTEDDILSYAHSRDGYIQTHGTHTAGIAVGGGYMGKYRGVAFDSDICLVSNMVSDDLELIDSLDRYKYTTATDALGFQYCFDYAQSQGKPCVVSFSEGSCQDFYGDDKLLFEVLSRMTGPGQIFVASAGNRGEQPTYFHKPVGMSRQGTFLTSFLDHVHAEFRASADFDFRLTFYHPSGTQNRVVVPSSSIFFMPDSLYEDSLFIGSTKYVIKMAAYPSCYNPADNAFEVYIKGPGGIGKYVPISVEVVGTEADVEFFLISGSMGSNSLDAELTEGERRYSIHSPAAAPSAICVGANTYREGTLNYKGRWKEYFKGGDGQIASYSSIGPTLTGLTKPDVVAPGTNIISAYSSYYLEKNPEASDIDWDVEHFLFNGRFYAWNCNSGTSMSTPFVAGIIALWLEACPSLSPEDIIDVFAKTCKRRDSEVPSNLWGYGEIDAYAGLVEVLNIAADVPISRSHPDAIRLLSVSGGTVTLEATQPILSSLLISMYSLDGKLLLQNTYPAGSQRISITLPQSSGVYALQFSSADKSLVGSFLVRNTNK